ncbi:ssuD, alkanesulfonate monooxygenase (plasmid) [Nostoc flagelliforme CCNUN1]|uniref:SsuD, alkanesulfonate monooxygenase n=1 Tax=Nostoc flagelliforme CCNUN1 TaxID=2038116 RepID=A0A2K8T8F4_9NOSO|nr:LLM class flavin-dependent oxidoreductase [Nostoc flagelliforme]AUB43987.1 ssuD, alkanesulfonate monooxygenase [Nostoc flagelliforme CCNUN1]
MSEPRYGIWAPVGGNFGPLNAPDEPIDASYERTRSLVLEAERLGYVTTLVAQHLANPRSLDLEQLETWTACAALAEATESIEIIAAIKPLLFHPAVLAKMALGIDAISGGRFAINLISAWFRPEMERTNIPFPPHDERYRYSGEWLQVVRDLWSGERVNFEGEYFKIQDLSLRPFSVAQPYPRIYLGGASDPAQILAAQQADVYFINGQPIEDVRKVIKQVLNRPRFLPQPVRFGLSAFVIARTTDEEAQAELERLMALQKLEEQYKLSVAKGVDPEAAMFKLFAKNPAVGGNGGTAAGLVGSYDTVATRVAAFVDAGIDTFMLQFNPFVREMTRFAQEIMPRVQHLQKVA